MTPWERQLRIRRRLEHDGKATIDDLAGELGVSGMTVRRDLHALAEQGQATVSRGTAYPADDGSPMPAALSPTDPQAKHKQAIGAAAAALVHDGETIIVDCGTTTLQMLPHLAGKRLTIVTNSLPVAAVVGSDPAIRLVYAPGEYSADSQGLVGPLAVDFFRTLHVDRAFLGAHGFDATGGANEPVLGDATAKRAMAESCAHSYLLVDSSKYGNVHLMALSRLSDFSCVITDGDFPASLRLELEAACHQVIYA